MRTRFHLIHIVTGVLIAVFLGIHMVRSHLDDILGRDDPTSWESMMSRATDGLWVALYIALLAVALYHALYGLRGIILELTPSTRAARVTTWCLVAIGIAAFGWGTYVPIHLLSS
jgi:succinate dehydrogenase/fumarate reductase cytochrome b subunit